MGMMDRIANYAWASSPACVKIQTSDEADGSGILTWCIYNGVTVANHIPHDVLSLIKEDTDIELLGQHISIISQLIVGMVELSQVIDDVEQMVGSVYKRTYSRIRPDFSSYVEWHTTTGKINYDIPKELLTNFIEKKYTRDFFSEIDVQAFNLLRDLFARTTGKTFDDHFDGEVCS